MKNLTQQNKRLKNRIKTLKATNKGLRKIVKEVQPNRRRMLQIQMDSEKGDTRATVLLEQLSAYGKLRHKWSELMLRHCIIWRGKSAAAYDYARKSQILMLPSPSTLKNYLGPMSMEVGLTPLIKTRLQAEIQQMTPVETFCSLIFDEMAINAQYIYLRQRGRIFGSVNFGKYGRFLKKTRETSANRLLFRVEGDFFKLHNTRCLFLREATQC